MLGCCGTFWVERVDVSHLRLQDQNVRVVCSAQLDPVDLERMLARGVVSFAARKRCGCCTPVPDRDDWLG